MNKLLKMGKSVNMRTPKVLTTAIKNRPAGRKKLTMAALGMTVTLLSACDSGSSSGSDAEVTPPITQIETGAAVLVTQAAKAGSTATATATTRSIKDFSFPQISNNESGLSLTIPSGNLPGFSADKSISEGSGNAISVGDSVTLVYDMFSWSTGELVETTSELNEPVTIKAGTIDAVPEHLSKSVIGHKLGEKIMVVFGAGMPDLPEYFNANDAYVLVVELM